MANVPIIGKIGLDLDTLRRMSGGMFWNIKMQSDGEKLTLVHLSLRGATVEMIRDVISGLIAK